MKPSEVRQLILFLVLGSGLLVWAYFATPAEKVKEFSSTALISAAFILLAVALLNVVYWLAGGEPIAKRLERLTRELIGSFEVLKDTEETGLERILGTSRDFERKGGNWMGKLVSARRHVDLMGYSLLVWSTGRNFHSEVLDLLKRRVDVRILVMDQSNPHFEALVNYHQIPAAKDIEAVKAEVTRAVAVFDAIARDSPKGPGAGSFQFRKIRTGLVVCQICRVDEWLPAIPYLYSVVAAESPLLQVRGSTSELYRWYTREFDSLWELNA